MCKVTLPRLRRLCLRLFPEFAGRDLCARGPARLEHRARDGATVQDLAAQARDLIVKSDERAVALVTVGGNDLLQGLIGDAGPGMDAFASTLEAFVRTLPVRPVLEPSLIGASEVRRAFLAAIPC